MIEVDTDAGPPVYRRCECAIRKDLIQNVERGLKNLSLAATVPSSSLLGKEDKDLWVTARDEVLLAHLRHVALRQPPTWNFKVIADAEMTTAWLASIALEGKEILDADAYKVSTKFITIPDLVLPPDLLIIRMGIKMTPNKEAHGVLGEALLLRYHEGKPTWVWDQPSNPLGVGHIFWSDRVHSVLRPVPRVEERELLFDARSKGSAPSIGALAARQRPTNRPSRKSLRGDVE